jgi:hypothetical protein
MGKKCLNPDCGWDGNDPEWEFCGHCGSELTVTAEPPAQPIKRAEAIAPGKMVEPPVVEPVKPEPRPSPAPAVPGIKAKLVVIQTGRIGQEFGITKDSVNVGRLDPDGGVWPDIDLTQDDPGSQVSRKHATIFFKDGKYFIEDLGSTNGTFINKGPRLAPGVPQELKSGDEIIMGRTFLSFLTQ